MYKFPTTIFTIGIFLFLNNVSAQIKLENTLLWRISGNGLKESSYLYGTIHITDKRVFQLGDSVHAAINQTKGLAAEVEMLSFGNDMITSLINQSEDEVKAEAAPPRQVLLKDLLEKSTWKTYKPQLEKILKIKGDKITVSDLQSFRSVRRNSLLKSGEMPTFLDAWLLGFARKNGKWIGGIEDVGDQYEKESVQELETQIDNLLYEAKHFEVQMDWLIRQYLGNRLDSLEKLYHYQAMGNDPIMTRRNKKMAYRIDSLSAVRPTFFAVGAAHLLGEEGVIGLLRDKGFTVTPVFSQKLIDPETLPVIAQENYWKTVVMDNGAFHVKMPELPQKITNSMGMMMEMNVYFDFAAMQMYMSMQIPIIDEKRGEALQRIITGMGKQKNKKNKLLSKKEIEVKGMPAVEFLSETGEGRMRGQIIELDGKMVVMNAAMTFKPEELQGEDVNFFLSSFNYDAEQLKNRVTDSYWSSFTSEKLGFSVNMSSANKKEPKKTVSEDRTEYAWLGADVKNQIVYGLNVLVYNSGYYQAEQDTVFLLGIKDNLTGLLINATVVDSAFSSTNGYTTFTTTLTGEMDKESMKIQCKLILRGGMLYYIFTTYSPANQNDIMAAHYLNSFKVLPYEYPQWSTVKAADGSFSFNSPGTLSDRTAEISENGTSLVKQAFALYDSVAGYTVHIDKTIIPDWYWVSSDSAFLQRSADTYKGWRDSVQAYTLVRKNNTQEASFIVTREGTQMLKKVKLVLNGNELYELYSYISSADTLDDKYDYFKSFTITRALKPVDRSRSNITGLQKVLASATVEELPVITEWVKTIDFNQDELPVLKQMALTAYAGVDSLYYNGINQFLFNKVAMLDSAHTMIAAIDASYEGLKDRDKVLRPHLLNYLSRIKTGESFATLKKLLLSATTQLDEEDNLYLGLYDSLALAATLYPDVLQIVNRPHLWSVILPPLNHLLEKKEIGVDAILPYRDEIITVAEKVAETGKEDLENSYGSYHYTELISLLSYFNTDRTNQAAANFLPFDNIPVKFEAVKTLLKNNKPVAAKEIELLAKDDYYRLSLYEFLSARQKEFLFPKAYFNRRALAVSRIYQVAMDDDEMEPEKITFLEEKTVSFKGVDKKFLCFVVSFADEDEEGNALTTDYLAVVGPYSAKGKELLTKDDVSGIVWTDEYKKTKQIFLFQQYLESLIKIDEDNDNGE